MTITTIQGEKDKKQAELFEEIKKYIGTIAAGMIPEILKQQLTTQHMPITMAEVELMKFFCDKNGREFDKIKEDYNKAVQIIKELRTVKK